MSRHSELDATLTVNGNLFSLPQYKSIINHAARYYAQDPALQLIPLLGEQELLLLRGFYNLETPARLAALSLLDHCGIAHHSYD